MENQMSLLEIALEIIESKNEAIDIYTLIEEVLAKKGIIDTDGTYAAKLYTDITTSSKFVFMGDNKWDLKSRQSLDQFDKDGSSFNSKEDYIDDNEAEEDDLSESDLDLDDDYDEDEDEDDDFDKDSDDEDEDEDDDFDRDLDEEDEDDSYDEEDDSYDDKDEEKYNKYMDDYEDLYED